MAFFKKMFGKKAKEAAAKVAKMENKDLMEALANGSLLAAYCNGTPKTEDLEKAREMVINHPSMAAFSTELPSFMDKVEETFKRDFRSGKIQALREIADITASEEEKQDLIIVLLSVVEADGEIDDKEQNMLEEIAGKIGMTSFLKSMQ